MKSKDQNLLEEAYNEIKSINTNSSDSSKGVRVYIVVRKDSDNNEFFFKNCFFSLDAAQRWINGMAYPQNYQIKTYEGTGGKEVEIK